MRETIKAYVSLECNESADSTSFEKIRLILIEKLKLWNKLPVSRLRKCNQYLYLRCLDCLGNNVFLSYHQKGMLKAMLLIFSKYNI